MFEVKSIKGSFSDYFSSLSEPQDSNRKSQEAPQDRRQRFLLQVIFLKSTCSRLIRANKALAFCLDILPFKGGIHLHLLARFTTVNSEFSRTHDGSACHKSFSFCCASDPYKSSTFFELSRLFHQYRQRLQTQAPLQISL